ncbi:MAG: sulfatase-like hydrolase/transferase [Planctomycetales bacterium]
MKISTYFVLALVGVLFGITATAADRPNIIVMMVDDMGYAGPSIAPYGNPNYKTPGIDRLASEGMLFTDFHASGAICSATRAGLVTGRYQQRAGIEAVIHPHATHPEHRKGLHKSEVTFAELFKNAGYSTGLVGKWHLGYAAETPKYHPMNHGFDYFMGYVSGNIDYINHWGDHMQHDWWHGLTETKEEGYTTHLINKYALEFIEQNKDKPFCLYIAHESPHSPVQGPDDPIQRGPGAKKRATPHAEAMKQMILEMDKGVDQVRAKLIELGLEKNTLFLFFSDNGDAPGTATGSPRFRGHKGSVYEGGTRVPVVAWWPGRIKPGTQAEDLSITLDVMPTILSIASIAPPKDRPLDGIDLSSVLFEQKALPTRPLFWADLSNNGSRSEALRDGPWKLVVQHPKAKPGTFENETIELFNLTSDEGEKANLASEQPERAAAMLGRIKSWYADMQKTATAQPGGWIRKSRTAAPFFNGKDLSGWKGTDGYWSVKDGAIVGHSDTNVPKNEFLWSDVEVSDFYLAVDVKLTPGDRNAGIQFRSKSVDAHGQAIGYQADIGHDQVIGNVWGNLYHEHGRGKLDWNDRAVKVVKKDDWNRYEILAVGHRIWTAVNGTLCTAIDDAKGELSGKIALQIHGGLPQTVQYRIVTFTPDPKIELAGLNEQQLIEKLPKKELPYWSKLIAGADPGSQDEAWAKPTFDHSKWKTMKVPGHFDTAELPGFDGVVWLRKTIELTDEQAKSAATLHLGQIDDMDVAWVNGTRVGGYENPGHHYTVRNYPVPAGVLKPGKNVIAVRVMDHGFSGGIAGKPDQISLQLGGDTVTLANLWHLAPGATLAALNEYAVFSGPKPSLRPLSRPKTPVSAFEDGFAIDSDQTIAIVGSTNALGVSRNGYLETLLTAAHSQHNVRLRNLAWQADTVYMQQRPRNFYAASKPSYGEIDSRARIKADIVFFWMGQAESLDGPDRIEVFIDTYSQHLDQIADYTKRLVLVTPVPFSNPLNLELDIDKRNESLAVYADAIRTIGHKRRLPVVDLFTALQSEGSPKKHSSNGLHLSPDGHWFAAQAFASQLEFADRVALIRKDEAGEIVLPETAEKLRQAIGQKNDLWFRYWRPTNWAFLYGNRQSTASSRDHTNPSRRWFPEELQKALPHLVEDEQRIHKAVKVSNQ